MDTNNLVMGYNLGVASHVLIGAYGAAEGACVDLGRTSGGVEMSMEREFKKIGTDQDPGNVAARETMRAPKLKFKAIEATLANLAAAFNLPTTASSDGTLSLGSVKADGELYRALYFKLDGPNGGTRLAWFPKCVITGSAAHAYKKDEPCTIEFEVEVFWDTTQSAGSEHGTIVDTAADSTAPTVALSTPVDGGTVTKDAKGVVVWTFTEAGGLDASSIVYGNTVAILNITAPATASLVAGTIAIDTGAGTVTFTPTDNWTASDSLQALVTTGVKDNAGNALSAAKIEQFSVTA